MMRTTSMKIIGQDANGKNMCVCHFECDSAADLPAYNVYQSDGYVFVLSSTAHTIDTDKKYELTSTGTWIEQSQPWQPLADYSVLANKPQINGHTLTGNQSGADLGLQNTLTFDSTPTQNSANPVTSGGMWVEQQREEVEIGVVANAGAKNIFDIQAAATEQRTTTVLNSDGGITISCNAAVWATRNVIAEIPAGDYICSLFVDSITIGGGTFAFFVNQSNDQSTWTELDRQMPITSTGRIDKLISVSQKYLRITTNINNSDTSATNSATIRLMLRPAAITDATFQPYALPNPVLTPALIEQVDNGSKNIVDLSRTTFTSNTKDGVTVTRTGDTFTVTGTGGTSSNNFFNLYYSPNTVLIPTGTWVFVLFGTGLDYIRLEVSDNVSPDVQKGAYGGNPFICTVPAGITQSYFRICTKAGTAFTNTSFKIMICTKAAWDASHKYAPYRPSWQEMYDMILALQ